MKKKLLWIGSAIVALSPMTSLVACSGQNKNDKEVDKEKDKENIKKHSFVFDLEKLISVEDLLNEFNKITNVFMEKPAHELIPYLNKDPIISQDSFEQLKTYTNKIKFNYLDLTFKFKNQKVVISLEAIKTQIDSIKTKMDLGYEKIMNSSYVQKKMIEALDENVTMSNMPSILNNLLGTQFSMKMMGFMAIPDNGYDNYLNMMDAYHEFSWSLSQSKPYQQWIKTLKQPHYKLLDKDFKYLNVAHGEKYDAKEEALEKEDFTMPMPNKPKELNNLEAQLVLSLCGIYKLVK